MVVLCFQDQHRGGSTSPATVTLNATNDPVNTWYAAPELAESPTGDLVAGEPESAPLELASYDVSSGTSTTLTPLTFMNNYAGLSSMRITPDGEDVVVATGGGSPNYQLILQVSDLSVAGDYPTAAYTSAVAIASDGTVAAGTSNVSNEVFLFAPSGSTPLNTYNLGSKTLTADGVALTPDASELFAITMSISTSPPLTLHFFLTSITDPVQGPSTVSLAGPATVKHGQPLTLTGSLGGAAPYAGGQTLQVTRTDPAEPDGVALPDVTTAADGSFSITDTPPKLHANKGTVTYQVSYAGDAHLSASTATVSVTVK